MDGDRREDEILLILKPTNILVNKLTELGTV